jgi:MFS family permease
MTAEPRHPLARWLAINRTVAVVLLTVLFFGLGEELWRSFLPAYLHSQTKAVAREASAAGEAAWAGLWTVGGYAFLLNLFEGFCFLGGGQLTARLGDRGSLLLFACLTLSGYVLFLLAPHPAAAVVAALLILGWEPLSVPVTFTTVGATVEASKRGMAFAVQSIQKRLPRILGPSLAGLVLGWATRRFGDAEGQRLGMTVLVGAALALGILSLLIQLRFMPKHQSTAIREPFVRVLGSFPAALRSLLTAEVFTRWCDWLVREFVVLYLLLVRGVSYEEIGLLMALQHLVALATYLPVGNLTGRFGLQPFIGVTFVFFALFPLALALVPPGWVWLAFVCYGLREIGEPARKAMITSLLPESVRAQGVGLYWGVRSFAICPASLAGAALWFALGPEGLLVTAFVLGCLGAAVFYAFFRPPSAA